MGYQDEKQLILDLLENTQFTPQQLYDNFVAQFEQRATQNSAVRTTNLLAKWVTHATPILTKRWSCMELSKFKKSIRLYRQTYATDNDVQQISAPVLSWKVVRSIADHLWNDPGPKKAPRKSKRVRKYTSIMLYMAAFGGCRWGDIHSAQWDRITWFKAHPDTGRRSFKLRVNFTKNNPDGQFHTAYTISEIKKGNFMDCPYRAVLRLWYYSGKPTSGYLFTNKDNKAITKVQTFYQYKIACKQLYPFYRASRHTCRVTLVSTLWNLGAKPEDIIAHLHWQAPEMLAYYVRDLVSLAPGAPADLIANAIETNTLKKAQFHAVDNVHTFKLH